MFISTIVVVSLALIAAICGSVVAARKQLPVANAILLWFMPVWLYFVGECLNRGGCAWLVWIEVARQILTVLFFIVAAAYGPAKLKNIEKDYSATDDV